MLIYKNILEKLKANGYSSYTLMKHGLLSQSTLTCIRQGKPISTASLDVICQLLDCQPGEVLEYVPNIKAEEEPASE